MNNKPEYIKFILDRFNNLDIDDNINLFSGEIGLLDKQVNNCKYYLKLWIRYPWNIDYNYLDKEYKLGKMNVSLCDDYDDTGNLYIKFVVEDINIIDLYLLLKNIVDGQKRILKIYINIKIDLMKKYLNFLVFFDTGFYIYDDY